MNTQERQRIAREYLDSRRGYLRGLISAVKDAWKVLCEGPWGRRDGIGKEIDILTGYEELPDKGPGWSRHDVTVCAVKSECITGASDFDQRNGDAEFIANARTDLPRALDTIDALESENDELRKWSGRHCGHCRDLIETPNYKAVRIRTPNAPNPFCSMDCAAAWQDSEGGES